MNSIPPASFAPPARFFEQLESLEIQLEADEVERLSSYLAVLLEANKQFNLTAITNPDQAWMRHILDSLTLLPFVLESKAQQVMDVGSGGGLPGIPLAIAMRQVQFTLLEATGKKAKFLQQTASVLGLKNVHVINDRAENVGREVAQGMTHRDRYDVVIARAVGGLSVLLELTIPLARVGGLVLAMKGAKAQEEVSAAKQALHRLHAQVVEIAETPTGRIVIIEKIRPTPRTYPRAPGEPKRSPLR